MIELIMVMVVVGILAIAAVPAYNNMLEGSRGSEAKSNLSIIYMAEKIYRLNHGGFWPAGGSKSSAADLVEINSTLNIDLSTPQFYGLVIARGAGGATTLSAVATRMTDANHTFTINETGTITESS